MCIFCETSLAWMREKLFNRIKCVWQWTSKYYTNKTIINQICVCNYYRYLITIFMALPFVMCSMTSNVGVWGMRACSFFLFSWGHFSSDRKLTQGLFLLNNPIFLESGSHFSALKNDPRLLFYEGHFHLYKIHLAAFHVSPMIIFSTNSKLKIETL